MVRLPVVGRFLHAEVARHTRLHEGHMVGGDEDARAQWPQVEHLLERPVNFRHQLSGFVLVFQGYAEHLAGAGVVNEHTVHAGDFGSVILEEGFRSNSPLLLTREEDEGEGTLGLPPQGFQGACRFQHGHGAGAVVQCSLTQVPGIEVAAR